MAGSRNAHKHKKHSHSVTRQQLAGETLAQRQLKGKIVKEQNHILMGKGKD